MKVIKNGVKRLNPEVQSVTQKLGNEASVQNPSAEEAAPTSNPLRLLMLPYAWISSWVWGLVANDKNAAAKKLAWNKCVYDKEWYLRVQCHICLWLNSWHRSGFKFSNPSAESVIPKLFLFLWREERKKESLDYGSASKRRVVFHSLFLGEEKVTLSSRSLTSPSKRKAMS